MSNTITINVTVTCAAHNCYETTSGTMDLKTSYDEAAGDFRIERVPGTLRVFENLEVSTPGWGEVSDRKHRTFTQPGDWLCQKCL
jgi:hypothetical protein